MKVRSVVLAPAVAIWCCVGVSHAASAETADKSEVACRRDADGYCASGRVLVELGGAYDSKTVQLNVALGDVVTIALKGPLKIKTCKAMPEHGQEQSAETYCGVALGTPRCSATRSKNSSSNWRPRCLMDTRCRPVNPPQKPFGMSTATCSS